jgi:hypothetical protein
LIKRIKTTLKQKLDKQDTEPKVSVDFPKEGEQVLVGIYAIRISARPQSEVEVSVNDGEWEACRNSVGHWWFDWIPNEASTCKIVARCRTGKGRWQKSEERLCQVVDQENCA